MQESFAVNDNTIYDDKRLKGMSGIDVRAKLIITFGTSIAAIAISSIYAQIVLLAASLVYAFFMRKPKVMALTYLFVVFIMAVALLSLFIIYFCPFNVFMFFHFPNKISKQSYRFRLSNINRWKIFSFKLFTKRRKSNCN